MNALDAEQGRDSVMAPSLGEGLIECYFEHGWADSLCVVPPKVEKVDAEVAVLGGGENFFECKVAPRWGLLTHEVMAINVVMEGCKPAYAPVIRAVIKANEEPWFNLNGVQATTHMDPPLVIVNGTVARKIGMNGGVNPFESGNRANATIGRALRLIMFDVGGSRAPDPDKCALGNPARYSYCIAENGAESPFAPYHLEQGYRGRRSSPLLLSRRMLCHRSSMQRFRGYPRYHMFGDKHDYLEYRGLKRPLRGGPRPGAYQDDCRRWLDLGRYQNLSEFVFR
ncbi:hypothetical protein N9F34_02735 [Alphaproteobacteria bacterium]|nr:hypothetical protein [Alphaproteobacteria bacterium]